MLAPSYGCFVIISAKAICVIKDLLEAEVDQIFAFFWQGIF